MNRLLIGFPDKTELSLQLLQNDFPDGVTIIDPTGTLARAVADIVPREFTQHTLYLDPSDISHPVGINVLYDISPDKRHLLVEQFCAYFDAMYPEGEGTLTRTKSSYLLAMCLRLLLDNGKQTLLGVYKLLTDMSFSETLTTTDPLVKQFWVEVRAWDNKTRLNEFAYLKTRIGKLLMSPIIRNIVGQKKNRFSDRVNIIIADLDRAKLGDLTARLLGGLLIARSKGTVFINDFPFFAAGSDALASLFPQDRFTISLNHLDALTPALRQEVLGIDTKFVMRTNKKDAEELSFHLGLLNPRQLMDLDDEQVRTSGGIFKTQPTPSLNRKKALKKRTRACYAVRRSKVEKKIRNYLG